jgi:hypothetical protein
VRYDYLGSGNWCDPINIPVGDLIASDYLAAQGSVPPGITDQPGGIITYTSSDTLIVVSVATFNLLYPNGSIYAVPPAQDSSNVTKDTGENLTPSTAYFYYFSIQSPVIDPAPNVFIDGPYLDISQSALAFSSVDGRSPLSQGALSFSTSAAPTGAVGGAAGGTYGANNAFCGVRTAQIKMADGSVRNLGDLKIGEYVDDGYGGSARVDAIQVVEDQIIHKVRTVTGKTTSCGLLHTFRIDAGWVPLCDVLADYHMTNTYPMLDTVDGPERIISIEVFPNEAVVMIKLTGRHTYVLDNILTHNTLYKSIG